MHDYIKNPVSPWKWGTIQSIIQIKPMHSLPASISVHKQIQRKPPASNLHQNHPQNSPISHTSQTYIQKISNILTTYCNLLHWAKTDPWFTIYPRHKDIPSVTETNPHVPWRNTNCSLKYTHDSAPTSSHFTTIWYFKTITSLVQCGYNMKRESRQSITTKIIQSH